jgi:hypothetical protein
LAGGKRPLCVSAKECTAKISCVSLLAHWVMLAASRTAPVRKTAA